MARTYARVALGPTTASPFLPASETVRIMPATVEIDGNRRKSGVSRRDCGAGARERRTGKPTDRVRAQLGQEHVAQLAEAHVVLHAQPLRAVAHVEEKPEEREAAGERFGWPTERQEEATPTHRCVSVSSMSDGAISCDATLSTCSCTTMAALWGMAGRPVIGLTGTFTHQGVEVAWHSNHRSRSGNAASAPCNATQRQCVKMRLSYYISCTIPSVSTSSYVYSSEAHRPAHIALFG